MLFGRTLVLAACILSATALASAQAANQADSGAATSGTKAGVGFGFKSDAGKPEVKTEAKAEAKADTRNTVSPETKAEAKPEATATPTKGTFRVYKDERGVRHDPKGNKGISPFWEAIRRGDESAMARDFAKAEDAYNTAIGIEPKNPLAHFRRGQVLVRAAKLTQAEVAYQDAMRLADNDHTLRAAVLFVLADIKERQGQRDEAIVAWKAYADYLKKDASAKGYPETATERDMRLRKYNALVVDSKAVRERIELRVKEVEDANKRKTAKAPNANR